jgi:hypothetical protein
MVDDEMSQARSAPFYISQELSGEAQTIAVEGGAGGAALWQCFFLLSASAKGLRPQRSER